MKILASKTNKNNRKYALIQEGNTFGVWGLCSNYCRHAPGGIAKTWRYVQRNMTFEDAKVLYAKRSK